jgi:hypothetical protein
MYSPTNFVVSSEIGSVSTRGQHRRSATIDIQRSISRSISGPKLVDGCGNLWHQLRKQSGLANTMIATL